MESQPNPPEFVPPPPVIAPPPAPKPRKNRGWMIFAIIVTLLLALSVFGNLTQLVVSALSFKHGLHPDGFTSAREIGPNLDEYLLENNHSDNKVAVITVDGIITGHSADESGNNMVDLIKAQLDRANDDQRVKAVILKVDSPGGEVLASDQIYKAIRDFEAGQADEHGKVHKGKPVICSMGSLAASGGYYISSGCRWIVANDLTLTGSIGVIMHGWNYRGLMDKVGIEPMTYKSGKFKDMLSGERATNEIPPEEHAMVQGLINETYEKFKEVVADGRATAYEQNKKESKDTNDRGKELADDWKDFADGRVVSGKEALQHGFVDELGDFDDAVDRAQKIVHIEDCNLIEYHERYDIANLFSMFGQSSQSHDIKLQLDTEAPKLRAGLMYYLYQP